MAISDKTRKVLWGRSGNLCAICRQKLVVDETSLDFESVVGEECHIHSGAINGPRYDASFDMQSIDGQENLLLLCRVHHKMVDDQNEAYTGDLLRTIKANHERWVEEKLKDKQIVSSFGVKRIEAEIPKRLLPITTGYELFNLVSGCSGSYLDHNDDLNDDEVEIVGSFLQSIRDWIDIISDLEPIEKIRVKKTFSDDLSDLLSKGFVVFGARERQRIEGGLSATSDFPVAQVSIVRKNDPNIIYPKDE
jgi:hypothetical protein